MTQTTSKNRKTSASVWLFLVFLRNKLGASKIEGFDSVSVVLEIPADSACSSLGFWC